MVYRHLHWQVCDLHILGMLSAELPRDLCIVNVLM